MKVIITGASGMVGKAALLECIEDADITDIALITRSDPGVVSNKIRLFIHQDFSNFSNLREQLSDYTAAFLCMGISAAGVKAEEYKRITYDYTIALAENLPANIVVTYVSGKGTDDTGKSKVMWARVKGNTERKLLDMQFKAAYMFRPGIIIPEKGIKSRTKGYQFFYDYFMWLIKLIQYFSPTTVINTTQLGKAMIHVAKRGFTKNILESEDIIACSVK